MKKEYYLMDNIGKAKYTVNTCDGIQTHNDGSPFFGIAIFHNKNKRDGYVKGLIKQGYTKRNN